MWLENNSADERDKFAIKNEETAPELLAAYSFSGTVGQLSGSKKQNFGSNPARNHLRLPLRSRQRHTPEVRPISEALDRASGVFILLSMEHSSHMADCVPKFLDPVRHFLWNLDPRRSWVPRTGNHCRVSPRYLCVLPRPQLQHSNLPRGSVHHRSPPHRQAVPPALVTVPQVLARPDFKFSVSVDSWGLCQ